MRRLWHWLTSGLRRSPPEPPTNGHESRIRQSEERGDRQRLRYLEIERQIQQREEPKR